MGKYERIGLRVQKGENVNAREMERRDRLKVGIQRIEKSSAESV